MIIAGLILVVTAAIWVIPHSLALGARLAWGHGWLREPRQAGPGGYPRRVPRATDFGSSQQGASS